MRTREITRQEALSIASREESHFFDRKATKLDGKKTQKIGVAFANADGGEFYVGIADDKDATRVEDRWQGAARPRQSCSFWLTDLALGGRICFTASRVNQFPRDALRRVSWQRLKKWLRR